MTTTAAAQTAQVLHKINNLPEAPVEAGGGQRNDFQTRGPRGPVQIQRLSGGKSRRAGVRNAVGLLGQAVSVYRQSRPSILTGHSYPVSLR